MQTKPKAYIFMEGLLAEAEFPKGHWPQWIEALYPELHRVLVEELSPQVPDEHITEFSKIQMLGTDGGALQEFIDKHIPDSEEAFTVAFRKFRQFILRTTMLTMFHRK